MGSSMVMMCSRRVLLISSIMAARVVDLPEPVGPVTMTNPRGLRVNSWSTRGSPRSSSRGILTGMRRKAALSALRWKNALTRKRARPGTEYEKSISQSFSSRCRWSCERIE